MSQLVINVYAVMCELNTWCYISEWRDYVSGLVDLTVKASRDVHLKLV